MANTWSGFSTATSVNTLTEFIRHAAQDLQGFAQLCNPPTGQALGKGRGDTVQFVFYPNISVAGGQLSENVAIPRGTLVPVKGTYTVQEFGNATDYSGKLAMLSQLPVEDSLVQALIDDMRKAQNTAAHAQFALTDWIASFVIAGDEFRTDGDSTSFTNAADEQLTLDNLNYMVRQARTRLIPYFDGESYCYITGVTSSQAVRYSSAVTTMVQYDSGRAALNGEVGRLGQCRLVEDTHKITTVTADTGTPTGAALLLDVGFLVGGDAVIQEYALPPEIRAEDGDFGRNTAVAWYFIGAWKKIYSQALHSKEHVIKVESK